MPEQPEETGGNHRRQAGSFPGHRGELRRPDVVAVRIALGIAVAVVLLAAASAVMIILA